MRRAFTLLEVLVALTIAGLIALAARATLGAGIDTEERVQLHVVRTEGSARFRALLVQTLRHMTDAPLAGNPPFVLRDTVLADGSVSHVMEFYSRGFAASAGSGPSLLIRVAPTAKGLTIEARDSDSAPHLSGLAREVDYMRVHLLTQTGAWVGAWPRTLQTPASVSIELFANEAPGATRAVPLVVTTSLEGRP